MRIRDLIDALEEIAENDGDDVEVLIMSQPQWPFEYSFSRIVQRRDFDKDVDEGDDATDVFLLEGSQLRYGDKDAWNCM